jgi:hypothetical protein
LWVSRLLQGIFIDQPKLMARLFDKSRERRLVT